MNPALVSQYAMLVQTPLWAAGIALAALALCAAIAVWSWRGRTERRIIGFVAAGMTAAVLGLYGLFTDIGWWGGVFYHYTPWPVQMVVLLAFSFAAWTAWLTGYRYIAGRVRLPLVVYLSLTVIASQLVVQADRANVGAGLFVHRMGSIWWGDIVFACLLFMVPLLAYEVLNNQLQRDLLP